MFGPDATATQDTELPLPPSVPGRCRGFGVKGVNKAPHGRWPGHRGTLQADARGRHVQTALAAPRRTCWEWRLAPASDSSRSATGGDGGHRPFAGPCNANRQTRGAVTSLWRPPAWKRPSYPSRPSQASCRPHHALQQRTTAPHRRQPPPWALVARHVPFVCLDCCHGVGHG